MCQASLKELHTCTFIPYEVEDNISSLVNEGSLGLGTEYRLEFQSRQFVQGLL